MVLRRIKPCETCKRRRRKCEQPLGQTTCIRCARLKLDCTFDTLTNNDDPYAVNSSEVLGEMAEVDGSKELENIMEYVQTLELELAQLEVKVDQERERNKSALIPKQWKLEVVNGHLRLETGIYTLSDLLQYRQTTNPIRYLTPFNNKVPIQFRLEQGSLLTDAVDLLTKLDLFSNKAPILVPAKTPLDDCPEHMIDSLIHHYFSCYNTAIPLLHEPTFMAQYNQSHRQNALTLAICCFMSVSYCVHLPFTPYQKRSYGEYFYLACREQLDDLLDDPHRQLEGLMSIHFLLKFMTLTLRLKELRQMATLGFLLSIEVSKQALGRVEKELANRHRIMSSIIFALAEFMFVQRMDDIVPLQIHLEGLPEESVKAVSMLEMYKHLFELALHHDCVIMVQQLRQVSIGQVGQLSLEAMVRFDRLCLDWWNHLPKQWRYCDDPYDARWAIEHCDDDVALVSHSFLLTLTLGIYSALLHPQNIHDQVSDSIQNKAVMIILNCCELLLVVADRLKIVSDRCGFSCDCLLRVFDSLRSLLVHSKNTNNSRTVMMVMRYINRCLAELDTTMLSELGAPPMSPDSADSSLSYAKYPLPGNALIFDIISSSARSIGVNIP